MRRRRAARLPGLAIAWGAISGAGVLAERDGLEQRLQRSTGLMAIPVADALDQLGHLLAEGFGTQPVAYVTEIAAGEAGNRLSVLRSPAFETLLSASRKVRRSAPAADFVRQLAEAPSEEALQLVLGMLAEEVGSILQLPPDAIDPMRSLNEFGMDSLMALELRTQVEKRCHVDLPMVSVAGRTLRDLGERLLGDLRLGVVATDPSAQDAGDAASLEDLRRRHTATAVRVLDLVVEQGLEKTVVHALGRRGGLS